MSKPTRPRASPPAALAAKLLHPDVLGDLRGLSRLMIVAVTGVTDIVEDMHRNIAGVSPIVGAQPEGGAGGISGFVYRSVRGVTRAVGFTLDTVLGQLAPMLEGAEVGPLPQREAVQAALNGVLGDYLVATESPLAIAMQLRRGGQALTLQREALAPDFSQPASGRMLVLVHGLCMNDLQWLREGHDHGAALAQDLGYTPLYLHYNTGRHIDSNGREFDQLLEQLLKAWPVPVTELVIVGHSMGGLVTRSACQHAAQAGHAWLPHLKRLVFLGTPHHGAPLERAGNWVDVLLGISPYTAPFAKLGKIRSAGIQDLRHGHLFDDEDDDDESPPAASPAEPVFGLPAGVACYVVAATTREAAGARGRLPGDGLVPVRSALGQHKDPQRTLAIPKEHQALCHGINHFDLLNSAEVYGHIRGWLGQPALG